ncbi:MAG: hypothetical protein F6K19_19360 [Cyanothece sp. SIO1E1]|nr:hypothetical protein [Cyanothece sp. SIO1E1]
MFQQFRFRSTVLFFFMGIVLPFVLFVGCSSNPSLNQTSSSTSTSSGEPAAEVESAAAPPVDQAEFELATNIGKGISQACPVSDLADDVARNQCSDGLANFELLRDAMSETLLWGQQKDSEHVNPVDHETTSFNPLVWRRTYLSTFMITDEPTVEQKEGFTVIHLPVQFRNGLDAGAFPYPFWHSPNKWQAYQTAEEVLLVMKAGKIKGALRSYQKDEDRPLVEREWDGQWVWDAADTQEPQVTLYKYLLSADNPHVEALDATYRAFEGEMRQHSCLVCHSPDNSNHMKQLLLLNYPNQALTLRHETLRQIEEDLMPPPNGVSDPAQKQKLVELAKAFSDAGDQALAYEGEPLTTAVQSAKVSGDT